LRLEVDVKRANARHGPGSIGDLAGTIAAGHPGHLQSGVRRRRFVGKMWLHDVQGSSIYLVVANVSSRHIVAHSFDLRRLTSAPTGL
jgi:hypothetical protein